MAGTAVRELIARLGYELDDSELKKFDKQIDNTKAKSNGLASAAKGVGIAWKLAAGVVALGIGWISKNIISATIEMEGYRTELQAFTGSAESAAEALEELRDKTIDPLFGTGNLVNAYKQLRTVGMGAEDTSKMIDVLGDVANGSAENFNALSGVLTKVSVSGQVNTGTMRQLAMAGFGVQDMAQGLGVSVEKLNADIEAGRIGFNELAMAMEGATKEGGRFYMNAANQALTLKGSILILKDVISSTGDAIGTKVAPALANVIGYVTDLIKLGKSGLVDFGAKAFDYLIHMIAQVIIFFEVLQMRMKKYGGAFEPLKKIFGDVFGFLKDVIRSAQPFLMNLAQMFLVAFKPIREFVSPILEALKTLLKDVFQTGADHAGNLTDVINNLTPLFSLLGQFIGDVIGFLWKFKDIIGVIAIAIGIWKVAQWALNVAMNANPIGLIITAIGLLAFGIYALVKNIGKVKDFFIGIWNAIVGFFKKIIAFVKKNALNIANVLLAILFLPAAIVMAVVRLVIKHWDKIKAALVKVFTFVADKAKAIWNGIVDAVKAIVDKVKEIWGAITGFFSGLWDGVKNVASAAWDGIKNVAGKAWDGIKGVAGKAWDGIKKGADTAWEGMKKGAGAAAGFFKNRWGDIKEAGNKAFGILDNLTGGALTRMKDNFLNLVNGVKEFFSGLWNAIKEGPAATIEFVKNAFFGLFDSVKEKVLGVLRGIKEVSGKVWTGIKNVAGKAWDGIKKGAGSAWEGMKKGASAAASFMKDRWEDIKGAGQRAFSALDNFSGGALTRLKDNFLNGINKIKEFFAGLWEALKQGPAATFEYIKNAFFGLFDAIKEKFFGFISVIKDGWDKVKGFFSGIKDAVVNVATGGGGGKPAAAKSVNDMIVTPDGSYSTHPDDYIMAMKNPGEIIDALMRFLGGPQPAYAGAGGGSLSGSAMKSVAANNNYHSSTTSNETQISAPINVSVNASGMSPEMASAAVRRGVEDALKDAISGARGTIPSPEARRKN